MEPHYLFDLNLSQLFSIIIYSDRNKMGWLSQSTNHYPNRIKLPQSLGKPNHKLHGYPFPLPFQNWHSLKQTRRPLMFILHLLTILTLRHKLRYVFLHVWPPINSLQISIHPGHTRMNRISQTMRFHQQFLNQVSYSRDKLFPWNWAHHPHQELSLVPYQSQSSF